MPRARIPRAHPAHIPRAHPAHIPHALSIHMRNDSWRARLPPTLCARSDRRVRARGGGPRSMSWASAGRLCRRVPWGGTHRHSFPRRFPVLPTAATSCPRALGPRVPRPVRCVRSIPFPIPLIAAATPARLGAGSRRRHGDAATGTSSSLGWDGRDMAGVPISACITRGVAGPENGAPVRPGCGPAQRYPPRSLMPAWA